MEVSVPRLLLFAATIVAGALLEDRGEHCVDPAPSAPSFEAATTAPCMLWNDAADGTLSHPRYQNHYLLTSDAGKHIGVWTSSLSSSMDNFTPAPTKKIVPCVLWNNVTDGNDPEIVCLPITSSSVSTSSLPSVPTEAAPMTIPGSAFGSITSSPTPVAVPACHSTKNGPKSRSCWSKGFNISTDFDNNWPDTGVTRYYNFTITNGTSAPDGIERQTFLINGQYMGPTIFADWGDMIEVEVKNELQNNGTGMHWHGVRQWNNCWEDGVPGLTECPIPPGGSKTYRYQATQYGTAWYHSHVGVQYGDGVLGMIVINGPTTANYDEDLGVLPVSDWYYDTASTRAYTVAHTFGVPRTVADNGLINSTMVSPDGSTGAYAVTNMQAGKKYKLRLVNAAVDNNFVFSLDNHAFLVVAADFVPVQPFYSTNLFIAIGQRYDVIVTADQPVDNYWFRAEVQDFGGAIEGCGQNSNNGNIKSIFRYKGAEMRSSTSVGGGYPQRCSDEPTTPYWDSFVPSGPIEQGGNLNTSIQIGVNPDNSTVVLWGINAVAMNVNWDAPILGQVINGTTTFNGTENVITLNQPNQWYYWVVQEVPGNPVSINVPHPMHLHGHDFYVLGSGTGNFSAATANLNYDNPTRRDTTMLPAGGWVAVAFVTDNPGAWLMHCHVAWHVEQGMAVQFLETANLTKIQSPASDYVAGCDAWNSYYPGAAYQRWGGESGL